MTDPVVAATSQILLFPNKIRAIQEKTNLPPAKIAEELGISRMQYYRLRNAQESPGVITFLSVNIWHENLFGKG